VIVVIDQRKVLGEKMFVANIVTISKESSQIGDAKHKTGAVSSSKAGLRLFQMNEGLESKVWVYL
jgi:hypothetical protein